MSDRILIAGTNSGCGKTTVICALLAALKKRGVDVASFKCGPDYIDPMFHREALGIPSQNLDLFFCSQMQLQSQLAADQHKLHIIEGVMGYYDGIGTDGVASTHAIAKATSTPVILVVHVKGMYTSTGALLQGFSNYQPDSGIRGVIFNGATPMLYEGLQQIARDAGVIPLGFLPFDTSVEMESRHLGLVTANEIVNLQKKLDTLALLAEQYIDLDQILQLAAKAPPLAATQSVRKKEAHVRIAVARDEAFCFLYQENLALLSALGAELCYFSPIHDPVLPEHIQGLYLPGGYPELYANALSGNSTMLAAIKSAIACGLPTIAECGGFLYLHETLDGLPMVGVIHAAAFRTAKLQRFGYVTLTAKADNLLCNAKESIRAHEFHYYESDLQGSDYLAEKPYAMRQYACIHATDTLYAGFPHLYFPANPAFAENFIRKAAQYASAKDSHAQSY